jgi:uncharacterized protein (TIGR03437 family)
MLQQSWIHACFSLLFVGCAALLAGDASQNIPNSGGLKQAWLQALYGMEQNSSKEFTAQNAAQNLQLSFGSSETRLVHGNAALALRLVGYGRGAELQSPDQAVLSSTRNRIEYRRGLLIEWYVNEPRGLEQGFTFSSQPSSSVNGPLQIALEIAGALHPKLLSPREVELLDSAGHAVLRYGDLKAWDARGQELASRLQVEGDQIRLVVEDSRAVYPITIDPTVTQIVLVPSDGAGSARLGQSVAIAGNTAVVGAPSEGALTGAAYVFVLSGVTWIQQAKLTASDGASGDQFGSSVSLFGTTAVIGAPGNSAQGAAYVFTTTGFTWTQQAKLTASDGAAGDQFGISVAVSGPTAVVGASGSASNQGAAYIFTLAGTTWSQQAKLTASDAASGDQFGGSVSLSATTAVAGAIGKSGGQGAVYVFINSGTNWTQQAKLTASDGASGDEFGFSVAVSGDTVLAGAPVKDCQFLCGTSRAGGLGGAYVFARSGSSWSQQAELASSDGGGAFGYSVAVSGTTAIVVENYNESFLKGAAFAFVRSGSNWTQQAKLAASDLVVGDGLTSAAVNGSFALFGAPGNNGAQGEAYVFVQTGTTWTQQAELKASDATSADSFGSAISVNGDTALVSSPTKASNQGAVYVFVRSDSDGTWSQQAKLTVPGAASFGQTVSLSADTAVIGATDTAYVFVRSGTSWTQQAKLVGSDSVTGDRFGGAAAVDGDTAVIGASAHNNFLGAAYVFVRSGATWTEQAKLTASDAAPNDQFGSSESVSGDTILTGVPTKNSAQGVVYVFVRSGTTWTQQAGLTASDGASPDNFGRAISLSGDTALVGAYLKAGGVGAAYIFVRSGTTWTQQAELTAIDPAARAIFGTTVSIDGNLAVVGSYKGNGGLGEAYVFAQSGTNWTISMQLKAANGVTGDDFGQQVSISEGTVIVGAPNHAGGEGAVYVFPFPTLPNSGLVNAASFAHTVAPGSIVSMFGTNFANSTGAASVKPLPDTLNGVSILVNNVPAPLIFVNQLQANFQLPFETQPGTATVVVTANGLESQAAMVNVSAVEPGIFETGTNQAVVLNPDNSLADSGSPAKVGTVVVMYVTGLGPLDHPLPTGSPALSNPLSNATVVPTVTIGGANAVVQFAGMSPGFVGLGQINMVIPKLANGTYPVVVTQGSQSSNNPVMSVTQ